MDRWAWSYTCTENLTKQDVGGRGSGVTATLDERTGQGSNAIHSPMQNHAFTESAVRVLEKCRSICNLEGAIKSIKEYVENSLVHVRVLLSWGFFNKQEALINSRPLSSIKRSSMRDLYSSAFSLRGPLNMSSHFCLESWYRLQFAGGFPVHHRSFEVLIHDISAYLQTTAAHKACSEIFATMSSFAHTFPPNYTPTFTGFTPYTPGQGRTVQWK